MEYRDEEGVIEEPETADATDGSNVRAYVFVINNYTLDDELRVQMLDATYVVCGKEIAPTTGTPHLQGYAYWKGKKRFKSLKKDLPRANIRIAKGTAKQNKRYSSKQQLWYENGEMPEQGKRTDVDHARDVISERWRMRDLTEQVRTPGALTVARAYLTYHEPERDFMPDVIWYYGKTGTGKSTAARNYDLKENTYWCKSFKWWHKYDAHPTVIFDDFRETFCDFKDLLVLLDYNPHEVEIKGGQRQLLAKTMIFTTPRHPREMFTRLQGEDIDQLMRRIKEIHEFTYNGSRLLPKPYWTPDDGVESDED
jgi:hypothetical protein